MVVHRITGDGPKKLLLAPEWSGNKRMVLNAMMKRFRERGVCQGSCYSHNAASQVPVGILHLQGF
jgi:hypothetical protein